VGASSYRFSHGQWKAAQKTLKEKDHFQVKLLEADVV
jgi:hypothetical protein